VKCKNILQVLRSMTLFCKIGQYLRTFSMGAVSDLDLFGKSSVTDKWTY
jgi:hypothetical protein